MLNARKRFIYFVDSIKFIYYYVFMFSYDIFLNYIELQMTIVLKSSLRAYSST